jgi:hypothetical protein
MDDYVGSTKRGRFNTYQVTIVNGATVRTLHNAAITKITFLKQSGAEVTLTFGGAGALDSQLSRIGEGQYEWWITLDEPGQWRFNEEWSDTIDGHTVTVKNRAGWIEAKPDPFAWATHAGATQ